MFLPIIARPVIRFKNGPSNIKYIDVMPSAGNCRCIHSWFTCKVYKDNCASGFSPECINSNLQCACKCEAH